MTIYVDDIFRATPRTAQARKHGIEWCHMMSDGNLEELHQLAEKIGLKRSWFQFTVIPHYDLTPAKRKQAIAAGAIERTSFELTEVRRSWIKRWNGGSPDWVEFS